MAQKHIAVMAGIFAIILASIAYMNRHEYVRVPSAAVAGLDAVVRVNRFTGRACVLPSPFSIGISMMTCNDIFNDDDSAGIVAAMMENSRK